MANSNTQIEQKYMSSLTVWGAVCFSQVLLLIMVYVIKPELLGFGPGRIFAGENAAVIIVLGIAAVVLVVVSFSVKKHFFATARARKRLDQMTTGILAAVAICEAASLLGIITAFVFDNPYFFLWVGLGLFGSLLHFPRRSAFYDAAGSGGDFGRMGQRWHLLPTR